MNRVRKELKQMYTREAQPGDRHQAAAAASSSVDYAGNCSDAIDPVHAGPVKDRGQISSQPGVDGKRPQPRRNKLSSASA